MRNKCLSGVVKQKFLCKSSKTDRVVRAKLKAF